MRLMNLTGHPITLSGDGQQRTIDPSADRVWATAPTERWGEVEVAGMTVPVMEQVVYEVRGLPDEREDVLLYVPFIVAASMPERHDLVIGDQRVRDGNGRVVAVSSIRFPWPAQGVQE